MADKDKKPKDNEKTDQGRKEPVKIPFKKRDGHGGGSGKDKTRG